MLRTRLSALAALSCVLLAYVAAADSVAFAPLPAAMTDSAKHLATSSPSATFGSSVPVSFDVMLRSGDAPGNSVPFGQVFSASGEPLYTQEEMSDESTDGAPKFEKTDVPDISNNPDFQSFIQSPNGDIYLVSQFESPRPSAIYLTKVEQDQDTGKMTPLSTQALDLSSIGGAWILCAGQISPWGTHLAGEEYEPDARLLNQATSFDGEEDTSLFNLDPYGYYNLVGFMRHFDKYAADLDLDTVKEHFKPYMYGMGVEVSVADGGEASVKKWFTLGRNSKELSYVMPDNRTVYITDDGTNVGFFKFIADVAGDLSSGTLYAAKATQTDDVGGGSFDITWIELGSANQAELEAQAPTLVFSDIMEYAAPEDGACPEGFTSTNAYNEGHECLKVKEGAEKWAAFFETRRYGAMLGATVEFSKWEGFTYSPMRSLAYTAISDVRYGMEDNKKKGEDDDSYDVGGPNAVKLEYNPCGCIYSMAVTETYDITNMVAVLCGTTEGLTDENNGCSVEAIANPDNVSMMDEFDTLLIGEDTGDHQNDAVWAYNVVTGGLTRIATTPYGSETTSVYWRPNLNGFSDIMAAAQHPYGESDEDLVDGPYSEGPEGYVGYFVIKSADIEGKQIQFDELPVPRTEEEKSQYLASQSLVAGTTSPTQYNTLYRSGDDVSGVIMGTLLDADNNPIKPMDSDMMPVEGSTEISNSTDHTSILQTCGQLHLVTQYEDTPGLMYAMKTMQDPDTGALSVSDPKVVDFSEYGGLWYNCAGTPTAWETHLGSEEYEPDARTLAFAETMEDIMADGSGSGVIGQMRFFGKYMPDITVEDIKTMFKPYHYGHVTEVFVDKQGCSRGVKHFAMGRGSIELAHVMSDNCTALISEDGSNDAFYKFVADVAGDLSAGTLYAAKFTQRDSNLTGGEFDVAWIELGSGSDAEIAAMATQMTFTDIFEVADPDEAGACPSGYSSINAGYAGQECVMLKEGMEKAAAFLETRRYAAMLGASTELNKAEGLAVDEAGGMAFLAISSVEKGMEDMASKGEEDPSYDIGSQNDMRLEWNPCGCVYAMELDEDHSPISMKALVCGTPVDPETNFGNSCDLEGIANPDNVNFMAGTRTLLIGEDTSNHQNDVLWAYNMENGVLTRIMSTPYGAEVTSPQFYPNINGYGYIVAVVQHPYGESDEDMVESPESTGTAAWTGYIGPFTDSGDASDPICGEDICVDSAYRRLLRA